MKILEKNLYAECNFGDKRLTQRAASIGEVLSVKYGQPLSKIFKTASDLKRSYEFFSNPKTNFEKLTQPYFKQTAQEINGIPVVLAVGDTTFLDYKKKVQMDVLIASTPSKLKKNLEFTVDWAIRAIARLGGYLELGLKDLIEETSKYRHP